MAADLLNLVGSLVTHYRVFQTPVLLEELAHPIHIKTCRGYCHSPHGAAGPFQDYCRLAFESKRQEDKNLQIRV